MKRVYYLPHCDTCRDIIRRFGLGERGFMLRDIKQERIHPEELDLMRSLAGSYEALFSRRAIRYRELKLANRDLSGEDLRALILVEYTFLKRPVIIDGVRIFIGSDTKTLADLAANFSS